MPAHWPPAAETSVNHDVIGASAAGISVLCVGIRRIYRGRVVIIGLRGVGECQEAQSIPMEYSRRREIKP